VKKTIAIAAILSIGMILNAQRTEIRTLDGNFDKIEVFGKIEVELVKKKSEKIEIKADSDISLDDIKVNLEDRSLKISMTSELFDHQKKVQIFVPYQELRVVEVSGGSDIRSQSTLEGDRVEFKATSGGNIYLTLDLNAIDARVAQGSLMVFEGSVNSQVVESASGATYSAYDLNCEETHVSVSTGGKAKIKATKMLDAKATTKGWIGYLGNPGKKEINETLGGKVEIGQDS
jgi:hypothetical protein